MLSEFARKVVDVGHSVPVHDQHDGERGNVARHEMAQQSPARPLVIRSEPVFVRPVSDVGNDPLRPFAVQRAVFERDNPVRLLFVEADHDFAVSSHRPERQRELVAVSPLRPRNDFGHFDVNPCGLVQRALQIQPFDFLLPRLRKMLQIASPAAAEIAATRFYPVI